MVIKGKGIFRDGISVEQLEVKGKLYSDKDIVTKEIIIKGKLECNSSLNSNKILSKGSLEVKNNINAMECTIHGSINAKCLESTENIYWEFSGKSNIEEIKFNDLEIKQDKGESKEQLIKLIDLVFNKKINLDFNNDINDIVKIKKAIGNNISIDNCIIDELICKTAKIGHNCIVNNMKCAGEYSVAEDSKVNIV